MNNYSVKELVENINKTRTQASASAKDEVEVMRSMLNDKDYKVDIYTKKGVEGQYCPREAAVNLASNIIKGATSVSSAEANELAGNYEFTKADASLMIGISKEFINTYLETGRKLPLGGRENSNISIKKKVKEETVSSYPMKVGVNGDGSDKYETVPGKKIPAHGSIKVFSPCPSWLTK